MKNETFKYLGSLFQIGILFTRKQNVDLKQEIHINLVQILDFFYENKTYKNHLPVKLHACETWSITLREKLGLNVFQNRILGQMFG